MIVLILKIFTGRDIDMFYSGNKINKLLEDTIILNQQNKNQRLYINHKKC